MPLRQSGQVLPLAVVCLFVGALFMYFAVSSGQLVDEKIRIANAADAAVYSAATVEARALNYSAYATRAIIANQVSLAQALSLASWTNYFADLWVNLDHATERLGDLIPPNDLIRWGQLQAVLAGEAYATVYGGVDPREIAQYVNYGAAAAITAADLASQGLELSETLVRQSVRQHPLAAEVARTTDDAMRVSIVPSHMASTPLSSATAATIEAGLPMWSVVRVTISPRNASGPCELSSAFWTPNEWKEPEEPIFRISTIGPQSMTLPTATTAVFSAAARRTRWPAAGQPSGPRRRAVPRRRSI